MSVCGLYVLFAVAMLAAGADAVTPAQLLILSGRAPY